MEKKKLVYLCSFARIIIILYRICIIQIINVITHNVLHMFRISILHIHPWQICKDMNFRSFFFFETSFEVPTSFIGLCDFSVDD